MSAPPRNISVVLPFFNEVENVASVLAEIRAVCPAAEIVAVDDGSTDGTAAAIAACPEVMLVRFPKNLGQSAALYAGLTRATAPVCVTMDGDGQNDPADIPKL